MGVTKIRTKDPGSNLVEICKKQAGWKECSDPAWRVHTDAETVEPPQDTLAVVINVGDNKAAIRIFETQTWQYVDGVGTEEAGNVVIVPWQSGWSYFCTGSPKVGWIKRI